MPYWTEREDEFLRREYRRMRVKVLARELPRHTIGAIYQRASAFGLEREAAPHPRLAKGKVADNRRVAIARARRVAIARAYFANKAARKQFSRTSGE